MRVTLYGTRGSIPAPGPETMRYGGNTAAVQVCAENGAVLVLDAGTGIRRIGAQLSATTSRVDILLTHLDMDHIQGLGFFSPLYNPAVEVHLWRPASSTLSLEAACHAISPHLCFQYTFAICRAYRAITSHAPASILVRFVYRQRSSLTPGRRWATELRQIVASFPI
jgi:phosphoribosyl 1,2-cyclic phosphodiesterase